jgi:hypothetical protein
MGLQMNFRKSISFDLSDFYKEAGIKREFQYISTDEKIADILTMPLSKTKFVYFIDKLGMM